MASVVMEIEPKRLWKHFDALTKIPRPSTKEAAAREYVLGIAKSMGWKSRATKSGISWCERRRMRDAKKRLRRCCKGISIWSARRTKARYTILIPIRSRCCAMVIG